MKNMASKFYGAALAVGLTLLGLAGPVLLANLFLLFPVNVLADSVSPSTYTTNLALGNSVTINKIVVITAVPPTSAMIDVFFLADTTGSMGEAIQSVKDGAAAIMSSTSSLGDVAYAVGEYKDYDTYDPYVYRLNQDITKDTAAVQAGIDAWVADGGDDYEEGQLFALDKLANTTSWRAGSTRILVWFGDAPGHDPSGPPPGVIEADATAALVAKSIKVEALDLYDLNGYVYETGISGQAQRIATATGGQYFSGVAVDQIVQTIKDAIISSFDQYSTVSLGTASVPAGMSVNVSPSSYTGKYDRSKDNTFNFSVTFTGNSSGSYNFSIPVLVDNGVMAVEQDNIKVGFGLAFPLPGYTATTAPVSAVMDNSVVGQFYVPGDVITAFNGETGEKQYGVKYMDSYGRYWPAYKNSTGTDFFPASGGVRPLNYINGPWLSYAGNAGYNYQVPEGTPVLATADGKLYKAVTDPVNGAGYDYYCNSYIDHGENGFHSWYLYVPLDPTILSQISLNGYAQVTKGQVIGKTIGDHLHFEMRLNGDDDANVVDPYKLGLWQAAASKSIEPAMLLLLEDTPYYPPGY